MRMKSLGRSLAAPLAFCALALSACAPAMAQGVNIPRHQPMPDMMVNHASFAPGAILYQINTRQFTKEGTFRAAEKELPRLKELGVNVIWLMPIHPIGEKNRKGTLGSPYSVKDYFGVNPEFGTKEDLKHFIDAAHAQGFAVILDWVANHSAWDNPWVAQHPDWYERDWKGDFHPTPWWDWSDIIDLNYDNVAMREEMARALVYWVKEFGVDGYRADVAGYVPLDFWEQARSEMEEVKPVFMLAEWNSRDLHRKAFDATYAWQWHTTAKNVAQGKGDATAFYGYYSENESGWPRGAMRMPYIENHDSNAWEGTIGENFGPAANAMTVLSFIGEGIPMVYNGQEACNAKRLEFFEKDAIDWGQAKNCSTGDMLKSLIAFRKGNPALQNGKWGARMVKVENSAPSQVFSWTRGEGANQIVAVFNMSDKPATAQLTSGNGYGAFKAAHGGPDHGWKSGANGGGGENLSAATVFTLAPWEYRVYYK